MKSKIIFAVLWVVGVVAAAVGGFRYGFRLALNDTVNNWAVEQANDVQGHLITLRYLRAKKIPEALKSLDARLDNDLAILEPQAPEIKLADGVRKQIDKAFLEAKNYHTEFPPGPSK